MDCLEGELHNLAALDPRKKHTAMPIDVEDITGNIDINPNEGLVNIND